VISGCHNKIEAIQQRLMESEYQPDTIEKWYKRTINLDRNWRKSKKNEQGLRSRREMRFQILRQNNNRTQWQQML